MNVRGGHPQPREEGAAGAHRHGGDRRVEGDSPKKSGQGEQGPAVRMAGESPCRRQQGQAAWSGRASGTMLELS